MGTLYAVLILSVVLVLGNLFKQIRPLLVDQVAPVTLVVKFVINVLPFSLMFTIPWGFLTAVLLIFGRLSSDQEITAFRVAGVSLPRLAVPVFVIGAALSGVCLYLNINVVPLAKASIGELLYEQAKQDPRSMLNPGKVQAQLKGQQKLFVESRDGDALLGFHLYQLKGDDGEKDSLAKAYVHAGRVTLVVDEAKKQLRLKLTDAFIETEKVDGSVELAFAGEVEPWLLDIDSKDKKPRSNSMTNGEIRTYLKENPTLPMKRQVEFRAEITKRYSFSMACLAFAFVAVPLGLKSRRKDTSMGLIISLLLGAGYFLFSVISAEFKSDLVATSVLWLPNVLCVLTGLVLFRRARFK
jgi:lipopolysaccharide export system permease protein